MSLTPQSSTPSGIVPLKGVTNAVLKLAQAETDPIAIARATYRRVWDVVVDEGVCGERVGGRWFVREENLPQVAAALGLTVPMPKLVRGRRAPSSSNEAAVPA